MISLLLLSMFTVAIFAWLLGFMAGIQDERIRQAAIRRAHEYQRSLMPKLDSRKLQEALQKLDNLESNNGKRESA